jgi:hypothetical protein
MTDSWIRLTKQGAAVSGVIWHGNELYGIEPSKTAEQYFVTPNANDVGGPIIYRLSNTVGTPTSDLVLPPRAAAASIKADAQLLSLRLQSPTGPDDVDNVIVSIDTVGALIVDEMADSKCMHQPPSLTLCEIGMMRAGHDASQPILQVL